MRALMSRLRRPRPAGADPRLNPMKLRLIDRACERGARSLADLGAVWAVDGGYTFHALEKHELDRAVIVDDDISEATRERAAGFPQLELVEGQFGSREAVDRVADVDLLLLFDVLLHQVAPDWHELLELHAPTTKAMAIVQPQWMAGEESVRLIELGREEYLRNVPPLQLHDELFDRLDEWNERRGRPERDIHDVWQWGITDKDLTATLDRLGFDLAHREDEGSWHGLENFHYHAFLFERR